MGRRPRGYLVCRVNVEVRREFWHDPRIRDMLLYATQATVIETGLALLAAMTPQEQEYARTNRHRWLS